MPGGWEQGPILRTATLRTFPASYGLVHRHVAFAFAAIAERLPLEVEPREKEREEGDRERERGHDNSHDVVHVTAASVIAPLSDGFSRDAENDALKRDL
jgi:hypothetical protein